MDDLVDGGAGARYLHQMKTTRRYLIPLLMIAFALSPIAEAPAAGRPESPARDTAPDAPLPFRAEIASGRLANGLEWFALEHPFPADTVVLRLVIDAGSVLETDSQRGLAHFVEHMAFNGTEEFGETELVAYLESLGMRFGPDVNAYTSFDETVYQLELPSDNREALETGFRVMQQWASALTLEAEAIDRERGVIVEEWRTGRSAARRMSEDHLQVLLAGSRYADRLPIGDMDVVRSAPRSEFVDFYERWYRPDNAALIAVGDLPVRELERLIAQSMGEIERPAAPLGRAYPSVDPPSGTLYNVVSDPEATQSSVSLYLASPPSPFETVGDYREQLTGSLFGAIINERLREVARDPDSAIIGAGLGTTRFVRDLEVAYASAIPRDERVPEALEILLVETERAARFGVTEVELARARSRLLESIESARVNFESRESASLADELVRHWTQGEPIPGIEAEYDLYRQLLPTITTDDLLETAQRFVSSQGRLVLASLREGEPGEGPDGAPLATEGDLAAVVASLDRMAITPPREDEARTSLLDTVPEAGAVVARLDLPAIEATGLLLSNGLRVIVKPTQLAEDEVLVGTYSPGGLSQVPDGWVAAARLAVPVVSLSGLGSMDAGALERALAGRSVSLSPSIGRSSEGFEGAARRADLPVLFELLHLYMTAPRFDERALENVRQQALQATAGQLASPQGRWQRRLQELFSFGDPRVSPMSAADIAAVTREAVATVYRERFAAPSDMTVVVVGSVDVETVADLAERYLASIGDLVAGGAAATGGLDVAAAGFRDVPLNALPAIDAFPRFVEEVGDNGYRWEDGIVREVIEAGSDPVAQVAMVIHAPYEWSRQENQLFLAVSDLLAIRLREVIREESGGTYGVGASGLRYRRPVPRAFFQVFFGMDPERAQELTARALEVIEDVRSEEPDAAYVERVRALQMQAFERGIQENGFWLGNLLFGVEHGRDLERILELPELIESITASDITRAARQYLDPANRVEVLLLPESGVQ